MLENHMVVGGAAPEPGKGLTPEREDTCIVCGKCAVCIDGDWFKDYETDTDGSSDWLSGIDELEGAGNSKYGFTCSIQCRSQAMYNHATPEQKAALNDMHDACLVIVEQAREVIDLVNRETDAGLPQDQIIARASEFLDAIGNDGHSMPDWCNQPSRAEQLEDSLLEVRSQIAAIRKELL